MTLTDLDMLFQLGLMNICRWPVSRKNAHIAYRKTALELSEVMDEDRAVMLTSWIIDGAVTASNLAVLSHVTSFRTAFMDLNLYWIIKGALASFVLVYGYVC